MKRYYHYAGLDVCIEGDENVLYHDDSYLKPFRIEDAEDPYVFTFKLVEKLKEREGTICFKDAGFVEFKHNHKKICYVGPVSNDVSNAYMRIEEDGKKHEVSVLKSAIQDVIPLHTVFHALRSERIMAKHHTIMFHASYIEYKGKAILFTAPSGTGKSTQASLWERWRDALIVNGDRAAIQQKDGNYFACGVPFAGSSNICKNTTLPLGCIVCLKQAKENKASSMKGFEAFLKVYEGSGINTWDREHVDFVSSFVEELCTSLPILKLECTPDKEAVKTLEAYLEKVEVW